MTTDTDIRLIALDHDALVSAYDAAKAKCADDPRWLSALQSAYEYLSELAVNGLPVELDETDHLRVESRTRPGTFYWANGTCSCRAAQVGNPCWHRAASRLVWRTREIQSDIRPAVLKRLETVRQQATTKAQRHAAYTAALADVNELFSA